MPRLVQSPAIGLLSLLTSKDGGIGPNALMDEYRATVSAQPLLGLPFRRHRFVALTTVNINAALGGVAGWVRMNAQALAIAAGFRCPDNKLWHVISFGAAAVAVNGTNTMQIGWDFTGNGGLTDPVALTWESTPGGAPGVVRAQGVLCDFWAGPGQGPAVLFPVWNLGVNDSDLPQIHLEIEEYDI